MGHIAQKVVKKQTYIKMKESEDIRNIEVNEPEEVKRETKINYDMIALFIVTTGILVALKVANIIEWNWLMISTPMIVLLFIALIAGISAWIHHKEKKTGRIK